jgi:hypothetical protein
MLGRPFCPCLDPSLDPTLSELNARNPPAADAAAPAIRLNTPASFVPLPLDFPFAGDVDLDPPRPPRVVVVPSPPESFAPSSPSRFPLPRPSPLNCFFTFRSIATRRRRAARARFRADRARSVRVRARDRPIDRSSARSSNQSINRRTNQRTNERTNERTNDDRARPSRASLAPTPSTRAPARDRFDSTRSRRRRRRVRRARPRDRGDDARVPANRDDRARAVPTAATDRFYDSVFIRYRSRCVMYDLVRSRRARKKKRV